MYRQRRIPLIDDFRSYVASLVVDHRQQVGDVARHIGIDTRLLGRWVESFGAQQQPADFTDEVAKLRTEIERLEEERDALLSSLTLLLSRIRSKPLKNTDSP